MRTDRKDKSKADIYERRARVLNMRRNGATIQQIATREGMSIGIIADDLKKTLAELHAVTIDLAETNRQLELERIDAMMLVLSKDVFPSDGKPSLYALDRMLKLSQERSKLLGLYAPEALNVNASGASTIQLVWGDHPLDNHTATRPAPEATLDTE